VTFITAALFSIVETYIGAAGNAANRYRQAQEVNAVVKIATRYLRSCSQAAKLNKWRGKQS
jgi:hypothetical protein